MPLTQVTMNADGCAFVATVNGFPIFRHEGDAPWSGSTVLDPVLIGKGNKLEVKFTRKDPNARFSASVKAHEPGDIVDTSEKGDLTLPDGDLLEHTFDSEADSFKSLLENAKPADAKSMIDFALKYRDAIRSGDTKAMLALNRLRINDIAAVHGAPPEMLEPQILEMLKEFAQGGADFEAEDIEAIGWCNNKVWELRRKDGAALLHKKEQDGSMSSETYAAILPEGPQVVR